LLPPKGGQGGVASGAVSNFSEASINYSPPGGLDQALWQIMSLADNFCHRWIAKPVFETCRRDKDFFIAGPADLFHHLYRSISFMENMI
jgi:hypothetical protein